MQRGRPEGDPDELCPPVKLGGHFLETNGG